jgi:hypothetical protein
MQNNAPAAPAADGSASALSSMMLPPKFVQDSGSYLATVSSRPPSRQAMAALAGPVANWFSGNNNNNNGSESSSSAAAVDATLQQGVASVYLQAASVQLKDTEVKVGDVEQEMVRTKQQYEVLEVRERVSQSEILNIAQAIIIAMARLVFSSFREVQISLGSSSSYILYSCFVSFRP